MSLDAFAAPLALAVGALGALRLVGAATRGDASAAFSLPARLLCGVAFLAAAAGWLVAAGVYSRAAAYALCGVAGLGWLVPQPTAEVARPAAAWRGLEAPLGAAIAAFAALRGLGALHFPHYNPCDDFVVYLHFPSLLLETGGFDEPFSMRRLGVLGSGPFVQGFFWPGFGISGNALADATFGQLATAGGALAVACAVRVDASRSARLALVASALAATLAVPYLNTLPTLLPFGAALWLVACHARAALRPSDAHEDLRALAWGAVAALLIGLRVSNAVLPGALWACAVASAAARGDRARLRACALAALATALALAPWCAALWRSSGTPLFPLFEGNHRGAVGFAAPLSTRALVAFLIETLRANRIEWVAALAALAAWRRPQRALALQLAGAAALVVAATAVATSSFDGWTVQRYCAPLVMPVLLALAALLAFEAPRGPRQAAAALLVAGALFVPVTTEQGTLPMRASLAQIAADDAREWLRAAAKFARDPLEIEAVRGGEIYRAAEARLPRGARLITATEESFRWHRDVRTVHTLDFLGQVSPPPGMPFFVGAEPVADYLTSLGYTHLAFTPPRASLCLYSAAHWQANLAKGRWMWRQWAPYFLDFMRTQHALAQTRAVVYRAPRLVVLDLRARVSRASPAP